MYVNIFGNDTWNICIVHVIKYRISIGKLFILQKAYCEKMAWKNEALFITVYLWGKLIKTN
jgi:hypothetical protein